MDMDMKKNISMNTKIYKDTNMDTDTETET